ncbi:hypothetical protein BGX34_008542 [Mortierella sp. NVP85]|nr:hypothetical protein BGX34_008542 [Mortierella sp. NVP85]
MLDGVGDGGLVHLELHDCCLEEQGSEALRRHFATLVSLSLEDCRSVRGSAIRDILFSCPRLEILRAKIVRGRDVASGGPWVCQRLRELSIGFVFGESELGLQQEVFRRLSTLTRLEQLVILGEDALFGGDRMLEFRLENGMEQLASLQQLIAIGFGDTSPPQMGQRDVIWMLANWKKLRTIAGRLNDDPVIDRKVKSVFKILGIDTEP